MHENYKESSLIKLFGCTRLAVLSFLFSNEQKKYYLREIVGELGLGQGATQRELARLTEEGFLVRSKAGNRVYYQADSRNPGFTELKSLLAKTRSTGAKSRPRYGSKPSKAALRTVAEICSRYHVARLSIFGSSLRGEAIPGSDLDLLVEFEPGHTPGLDFFSLEDDLSTALGRKVDLNTPGFLSSHFREDVIREAEDIYGS